MDGAVFHYQYNNQQIIDIRPTGQQPLINLGKSKIDGGELEFVVRPVRSFMARLGLGFLDTEVQEGHWPAATFPGKYLPNAPSVSGTLSADWNVWTGR